MYLVTIVKAGNEPVAPTQYVVDAENLANCVAENSATDVQIIVSHVQKF